MENVQVNFSFILLNWPNVVYYSPLADSTVRRGFAKINWRTGITIQRRVYIIYIRTIHIDEHKREETKSRGFVHSADLSAVGRLCVMSMRITGYREIRDGSRTPLWVAASSQHACVASNGGARDDLRATWHELQVAGAGSPGRAHALARKSRGRKQEGSGEADRNTPAIERSRRDVACSPIARMAKNSGNRADSRERIYHRPTSSFWCILFEIKR